MFSYPTSDFQRILENLVFIAEIFANREDEEIPDLPFLELARSFEMKRFAPEQVNVEEKTRPGVRT